MGTTGHLLSDAAMQCGDRTAIVDEDRSLTYSQLVPYAEKVSAALLTARRGSRGCGRHLGAE